jgi:NNP family nitrate/nitrite transporter-like MFS transporter
LSLVAPWYSLELQGSAAGVVTAGALGSVLPQLVAQHLALLANAPTLLVVALLALAAVLLLFASLSRDVPVKPSSSWAAAHAARTLRRAEPWQCAIALAASLGALVALTVFLPTFLTDEYDLGLPVATAVGTLCAVAGCLSVAIGGRAADHFGGVRLLRAAFTLAVGAALGIAALPPSAIEIGLLFILMASLGVASGAGMQVTVTRSRSEMALTLGLAGAATGFVSAVFPPFLEFLRQSTGHYAAGFVFLVLTYACTALLAARMQRTWLLGGGGMGATARAAAGESAPGGLAPSLGGWR